MSANASPTMLPRLVRLAVALTLPLALGACDWFTDFKNQPKVEPWEPLSQEEGDTLRGYRGQPQYSVPVTGTFVAGYQISYTPAPATLDSIAAVVTNPTPVSPASLANGRKYYQINCAVCHGDTGVGNGPATRYGVPGISIVSALTKGRPDGYIWGIQRNGRGAMPTYNRIEEMDRWDVVNYVRALQGNVPNTAGVGPVGYPGQGGSTLPGYTAMAPTRPAPFARPERAAGYQVVPLQTGETATPAATQAAPAAPGVLSAPATGPARSTQPAGQSPAATPQPTTPGAPSAVAPPQSKGTPQ